MEYGENNVVNPGSGQASGIAEVERAISSISGTPPTGPKLKNLTTSETAYADWLRDKSPENMSKVLDALSPTINSEVTRYSGPSTLLRSKAKVLAIKAVKSFDPMSGAKLSTWVVTGLKPLSRYGIQQRDIHVPEVAARQAAAVASATERLKDELGRDPTDDELADEMGISAKRVHDVRRKAMASVTSGTFDEIDSEDSSAIPAVTQTDPVPFAQEAVYRDLSPEDKMIFDAATGMHGAARMRAMDVAAKLGISPAAVSQRAKAIGQQIAYVAENW